MTADRFAVVEAMTRAAVELGWLPLFAESDDRRITVAVRSPLADDRPHSRACGMSRHDHGSACSADCPTCTRSAMPQWISGSAITDSSGRPLPSVTGDPRSVAAQEELSS